MELDEIIDTVATHRDLSAFIEALRADLLSDKESWENQTLERFLEAMASWVNSMDIVYKNRQVEFPQQPSWKMVADILYAGKIYE